MPFIISFAHDSRRFPGCPRHTCRLCMLRVVVRASHVMGLSCVCFPVPHHPIRACCALFMLCIAHVGMAYIIIVVHVVVAMCHEHNACCMPFMICSMMLRTYARGWIWMLDFGGGLRGAISIATPLHIDTHYAQKFGTSHRNYTLPYNM